MTAIEVVTGAFEIHVFVAPLDPAPEDVERFRAACGTHMKPLLLNLDYVGKGFVGVLQTSRYVKGDVAQARGAAAHDAQLLRDAGFEVLREKVEAVHTNDGVPQVGPGATDRYFEFHVLIDRPGAALSNDDVASLRGIATALSQKFSRPVPLSYNALKPSQRFLNVRARDCGLTEALVPVREIERAVQAHGLEVKKVISEYICFDSNRAVDNGWLEPLPS